jgi:hypothetical protein
MQWHLASSPSLGFTHAHKPLIYNNNNKLTLLDDNTVPSTLFICLILIFFIKLIIVLIQPVYVTIQYTI